ncbi:hypothetical protein DSUL_100006 [Desulfovibrionales bacterium]
MDVRAGSEFCFQVRHPVTLGGRKRPIRSKILNALMIIMRNGYDTYLINTVCSVNCCSPEVFLEIDITR